MHELHFGVLGRAFFRTFIDPLLRNWARLVIVGFYGRADLSAVADTVEGHIVKIAHASIGVLIVLFVTACTTVDRNAAASLGTAGEKATQALSSQAAQASQTLGDLNHWWGIDTALDCVKVKADGDLREVCLKGAVAPPADPSVTRIIDILAKHQQAIGSLNQAYAAFVDLAHYNAGKEATAALNTAFSDINAFTKAASATLPAAMAIAPITTTVEKGIAGGLSIIVDREQNAQILAANASLQTANDALYKGLAAEKDAMTSVLETLQDERQKLYKSGFDAGIISPIDILTPVYNEAYPTLHLQPGPKANQDVIAAAAANVMTVQNRITNDAVAKSYTAALATLQAVSDQHKKLAAAQAPTFDQIETDVSNLQANVAQVGAAAATTPPK